MTVRMTEIKSAVDKMGEAHAAWTEKARATINEIGEEVDDIRDRLEQIEAKGSTPGRPASGQNAESREHEKLFSDWVRNPKNPDSQRKLTEFQMNAKSVSIGAPADGGYAVPEEIGRQIERMQLKFSPVRNLVKVSRASTSDIKRLIDLNGAESGWRSETGSVSETATPKLREIAPTGGELYAYPKATNWAMGDVFFNVGNWLADSVAEAFAKQEGEAVVSGNGSNKPTGMLNTTPVATADFASPLRAAAAYQYLAGLSTSSPPVAEIVPDALIDLTYLLNSRYRAGASWAMNSTTAGKVRKIKDVNGRYLWTDAIAEGQPNRLLGYPVSLWEDMPDVGTNQFPVAFGNFQRGYELVDRSETVITLDPYTTPGWTKFYIRKRVYGHVSNNDAVKLLKTTIT
jgi:HK97 family phage major capsid protein